MSNETLFYIFGISLVVIAVVVSFAGLRFKNFPNSKGLLIGGVVATGTLVIATSVFGWRNGEDEQAHHQAELAAEEGETEHGGESEATEETATASTTTTASTAEGAELFDSQGCSGCHTLADAGSTAETGPDLDGALAGDTPEFIRTSIVDPNEEITQGYPPDVMPQSYETAMTTEELDALVQYLVEATGGSGN